MSKLGFNLVDKNVNFAVPKPIVWLIGLSGTWTLLRAMGRCVGAVSTYVKSCFNARPYLDPVADKIQKFKKERPREPNSGPAGNDGD